jgi:hypothetical protein
VIATRALRLLPGLWLGALLAVALLAAPAAFAALPAEQAGRVVARLFAHEARLSLGLGIAVVLLERRRGVRSFNATMLLALGAVFCTVAGYYALQPMIDAARGGGGRVGFGALHAASVAFYGSKVLLVAVLAWRAAAPSAGAPVSAPARPS